MHMKKFYALICTMLVASVAWAADITFTFNTAEGLQALGIEAPAQSSATNLTDMKVTSGAVTMTTTDGGTPTRIWNSQGSYSLRVYQNGALTFKTSVGTITKVVVTAASASNFQFAATTGTLTSASDACTWTGSAASVTLAHTEAKNSQVATVVVTVSEDGTPVDPVDPDPVDPSLAKLDSLVDLYDMADGTKFQFTTEVYVNYQSGQYLYVMQLDDEGYAYPALIYGNVGREYNMGAVIPAGWTGTKSTYKGLVEVTGAAGLADATKMVDDEDYYSAFDVTGYVADILEPESGWENYKVLMGNVSLSEIDEKGNFTITSVEELPDDNGIATPTEVTIAGFNKFGIEYPENVEGETFTVEGMVTIYNGTYQIYPIGIETSEGERLWKIWYYGEDGEQVKVADSLYVLRATDSADGKLVYVTDNASQVLYDEYAAWGYVEWIDWTPDFYALDCGTDEALFNALSKMKVLAPGSVCGTLADNATNPRIVLTKAPQELAGAEMPEIDYYSYDLAEQTYSNGNQLSNVSGTYTEVDGKPYLYNPECEVEGQKFLLDFRYLAAAPQLTEGVQYEMFVVWKQLEEWEEAAEQEYSVRQQAPQRRKAQAAVQPAVRKAPRRILVDAPDYYTNYLICPLDITNPVGISATAARLAAPTAIYNLAGVRQGRMQKGVNIVVSGGTARKVVF